MRSLISIKTSIVGCLLLFVALPGHAQLTIDVIGGGASQIPITVLPLKNEKGYEQRISEIVAADLRRSGLFRLGAVGSRRPFPTEVKDVDFPYWRSEKAQNLVMGDLRKRADGRIEVVKSFKGNGGNGVHHQNFIDAVRSRNVSDLNSDVEVGHLSTGWCNLANIAFQTGKPFTKSDAGAVDQDIWQNLVGDMEEHLSAHNVKIESNEIQLSPMLTVDVDKEEFVGAHAAAANKFIKRQYREPYVVPNFEA